MLEDGAYLERESLSHPKILHLAIRPSADNYKYIPNEKRFLSSISNIWAKLVVFQSNGLTEEDWLKNRYERGRASGNPF